MQAETGMTYERAAIRKWFFLGGDTCPLTGVRLSTTKVPQYLYPTRHSPSFADHRSNVV